MKIERFNSIEEDAEGRRWPGRMEKGDHGDWVRYEDAETLTAANAALMEEVKLLQFQSSLNDTDLPDAELIAALSDTLIDVTDDKERPGSGTILSKAQCMVRQWPNDAADLTASRARIAELEGVLRAMLAIHPMHSLSDDTLLETARRGPNEDIRIKARLVGKARAALFRTSEEGK